MWLHGVTSCSWVEHLILQCCPFSARWSVKVIQLRRILVGFLLDRTSYMETGKKRDRHIHESSLNEKSQEWGLAWADVKIPTSRQKDMEEQQTNPTEGCSIRCPPGAPPAVKVINKDSLRNCHSQEDPQETWWQNAGWCPDWDSETKKRRLNKSWNNLRNV